MEQQTAASKAALRTILVVVSALTCFGQTAYDTCMATCPNMNSCFDANGTFHTSCEQRVIQCENRCASKDNTLVPTPAPEVYFPPPRSPSRHKWSCIEPLLRLKTADADLLASQRSVEQFKTKIMSIEQTIRGMGFQRSSAELEDWALLGEEQKWQILKATVSGILAAASEAITIALAPRVVREGQQMLRLPNGTATLGRPQANKLVTIFKARGYSPAVIKAVHVWGDWGNKKVKLSAAKIILEAINTAIHLEALDLKKSPEVDTDASSIITAVDRQEKYIAGASLAALVVAPELVLPILLSNAFITVAMGFNEPKQSKIAIDAWDRLNEKDLIRLERITSSLIQNVRDLREARQQLRKDKTLAEAARQEVDKCRAAQ